jgi:antitoxin (DNA-binding transcriptional repressor) of toxin-antitoxin stability system
MPQSIGIRELRASAGRVIQRVRKKREAIDITYRGQVVARLVPVTSAATADEDAIWAEIDELAAEIGKDWGPKDVTAAQVISDGRRG